MIKIQWDEFTATMQDGTWSSDQQIFLSVLNAIRPIYGVPETEPSPDRYRVQQAQEWLPELTIILDDTVITSIEGVIGESGPDDEGYVAPQDMPGE